MTGYANRLWRAWRRRAYRSGMALGAGARMEPERRLAELDRWVGCWVAVKDGHVVAAAPTSRELVLRVNSMGPSARGAVAQFVPVPSDDIVIGVG
jgi:hypothetical protein